MNIDVLPILDACAYYVTIALSKSNHSKAGLDMLAARTPQMEKVIGATVGGWHITTPRPESLRQRSKGMEY